MRVAVVSKRCGHPGCQLASVKCCRCFGRKVVGVGAHVAHVNLKEGKAFCFMSGPDEEAVRKAHEAVHLPFDSITEVRRVTGADLRCRTPVSAEAESRAKQQVS